MAKGNTGDILTGDWNPVVGCQRYSIGCRKCWFLDGILPWQQRLGNIPSDLPRNQPLLMEKRLNTRSLSPKKGIIGIAQHSDLFWEKTADDIIHRILDIVEEVGTAKMAKGDGTKYVLWSKRAERMASFLTTRYPEKLPPYLACGVSIENQEMADRRLPHLLRIPSYRFIMIEPMVGPVDLRAFLDVHWVVTGSETGGSDAAPLVLDWVRDLRDLVTPRGIPFFIKQLGNNHKNPQRVLDGRTWDEFPAGFVK